MTPERWEQVSRLFKSALARQGEERTRYLEQACATDAALRREVESLLAAGGHVESGHFISDPSVEFTPLPPADGARLEAGQVVGHYIVLRKLGAGGMGEVYLARDTKLGRTVALKVLPAALASDPQRMRRFEQEAKTASALNQPNILTVFEVGEAGPLRFIATEHVDGQTLREHMGVGGLGVREVLDIAIQIAAALDAAHEAGVVHRDIKPENVMVRRRDRVVKVLDFGLAKLTGRAAPPAPPGVSGSDAPTLLAVRTEPGIVLGTVSYMSPEQSRGAAVDARTDIWSLGCVLYEMLTGRLPFEGADIHRQIIAIQEREPPPLSGHVEGVPGRLEEIVRKALTKDPAARYQMVEEMLGDLRALKQRVEYEAEWGAATPTADSPVAGRDGPSAVQAPGGASVGASAGAGVEVGQTSATTRHAPVLLARRSFVYAALAALILVVGGLAAYRLAAPTEEIDSIAVLPLANVGADPNLEYLADGLTESLINSLSQVPRLKVMARSSVFRYKGQEIDPEEVGRKLNVKAALVGRVVQRGDALNVDLELVDTRDQSRLWHRRYSRALSDILALQAEISRELPEQLRLKLTGQQQERVTRNYTASAEAYQLYLKGRFHWNKLTEGDLKRSVELFNEALGKDPDYALAYAGLANSYVTLGANYLPPQETYPKAILYARRALELDDTLAEAHYAMAVTKYIYEWDWPEAEKEVGRTLELNPNYAAAHSLLSHLRLTKGQTDDAVAQIRQALDLDPFSLIFNLNLGYAYFYARQYERAAEQLRRTSELEPNAAFTHYEMCRAYAHAGKYEEAFAACRKARDLAGDAPPVLWALGVASALAGKKDEAVRLAETLERVSQQRYVSPYDLAMVYAAAGERERAFAWLDRAYRERAPMQKIKVEPGFDPVRSDPRFEALLRRMNIPQ